MEGAAESTVLDAARDGEQGKQQSQMVSIAQASPTRNRVDALTSGRLHNRHIDDGDMSISPAAKHTAARGRVVFVGGELSADSGSDEPPPSHYSSDGWDEDSSGLMVGRSKSTSSRGRTGQLLERLNIEQRISLCTELDAWFQLHLKFASQRIENFNSRELARDTVQSDFDVALKDVRDGAGAAEVRSVLKAKQFKDKIQKYQTAQESARGCPVGGPGEGCRDGEQGG
ncbi:unnamed protein product [Prorocentrum cordatum]|uniref:Uncharacterized protein n=1 Tax=Prorocentrum cordatum TaxID=2364126 RepID=A0ABN9XJV1_9DINO|nr:unnamed protein product [Polarella glacialis]